MKIVACTAVALLLANSPWSVLFAEIWQTRLRFAVGNFELNKPLLLWINDGLMTVFFFVIGLEIKREVVAGELRDPRKAALPIVAALGGMIVPAGILPVVSEPQIRRSEPSSRGYIFSRIGVRVISIYVVIGAGIWLAFLKSGVHPTVAGVLLGFLTPARAWVGNPGCPNVLTNVSLFQPRHLSPKPDAAAAAENHRVIRIISRGRD